MTWHSDYFSHDEMKCKCGCEQAPMSPKFMEMLDELRTRFGRPLIVSSGYRCPAHPIEIKKSKAGAHASAKAVDLAVERADAHEVMRIAFSMGFKRIGVQQKGSGRFIHLDIAEESDGFPSPTVWSY